jgi:nucleoside-diphosphate-sugar epimerase
MTSHLCDAAALVDALEGRRHVLVTGATGFIGRRLVEALTSAGHDVTVLTRDAGKAAMLWAPLRSPPASRKSRMMRRSMR